MANGCQVQGFNVYAGGQRLVHLTMDGMPTRYSYMLTLPQSETERLLTKRLSDLGVEVERSVQFANVVQQEDGITATLRHADATTDTVQARWLIGCDGAHSAVRKAVGLPFEGTRYEESFLLAYVRIEGRAPVDEARAFFMPDGPVGLLPLPQGRHYLIIPLLKETATPEKALTVRFKTAESIYIQTRGAEGAHYQLMTWVGPEFEIEDGSPVIPVSEYPAAPPRLERPTGPIPVAPSAANFHRKLAYRYASAIV